MSKGPKSGEILEESIKLVNLSSLIFREYPLMLRHIPSQRREDLRSLKVLLDLVGEKVLLETIEKVNADQFRRGWAANITKVLQKWSEIQAFLTITTKQYIRPEGEPDPEATQLEHNKQYGTD